MPANASSKCRSPAENARSLPARHSTPIKSPSLPVNRAIARCFAPSDAPNPRPKIAPAVPNLVDSPAAQFTSANPRANRPCSSPLSSAAAPCADTISHSSPRTKASAADRASNIFSAHKVSRRTNSVGPIEAAAPASPPKAAPDPHQPPRSPSRNSAAQNSTDSCACPRRQSASFLCRTHGGRGPARVSKCQKRDSNLQFSSHFESRNLTAHVPNRTITPHLLLVAT